jgi:hypothetical protein
MILVEKIVPVARERLVTVKENALLTEAARFLDGGHINLVVVCDKGGAMVVSSPGRMLFTRLAFARALDAPSPLER